MSKEKKAADKILSIAGAIETKIKNLDNKIQKDLKNLENSYSKIQQEILDQTNESVELIRTQMSELNDAYTSSLLSTKSRDLRKNLTKDVRQGVTISEAVESYKKALDIEVKTIKENTEARKKYGLTSEKIEKLQKNLINNLETQLKEASEDESISYLEREKYKKERTLMRLKSGKESYSDYFQGTAAGNLGEVVGAYKDIKLRGIDFIKKLVNKNKNKEKSQQDLELDENINAYQEQILKEGMYNAKKNKEIPVQRVTGSEDITPDKKPKIQPEVTVSDLSTPAKEDLKDGFSSALEKTLIPFLEKDFLSGLKKLIKKSNEELFERMSALGGMSGGGGGGGFYPTPGNNQPGNNQPRKKSIFSRLGGKLKSIAAGGAALANKTARRVGGSIARGATNIIKGGARLAGQGLRSAGGFLKSGASRVLPYASTLAGGAKTALGASSMSSLAASGGAAVAGASALVGGTALVGGGIGYGLEKYGGVGTKTLNALGYNKDTNAQEKNQEITNKNLAEAEKKFEGDPLKLKLSKLLILKNQLLMDNEVLSGEEKERNENTISKLDERIATISKEIEDRGPFTPVVKSTESKAQQEYEHLIKELGEKNYPLNMDDKAKATYDKIKENIKIDTRDEIEAGIKSGKIDLSRMFKDGKPYDKEDYIKDQIQDKLDLFRDSESTVGGHVGDRFKMMAAESLGAKFEPGEPGTWFGSEYKKSPEEAEYEEKRKQIESKYEQDIENAKDEEEKTSLKQARREEMTSLQEEFPRDLAYKKTKKMESFDELGSTFNFKPTPPIKTGKESAMLSSESINLALNQNNYLTSVTNQKLDELIYTVKEKDMGGVVAAVSPNRSPSAPSSPGEGQSQSPAYAFRSSNRADF